MYDWFGPLPVGKTMDFNPREEYDHLGKMVCFHKRYALGDKHDIDCNNFVSWHGMEAYIVKKLGAVVVLPLYLYDHSGITMNTTGFSCPWDSGQVGFIYATREDVLREMMCKRITKKLKERVEAVLQSEVEEYDQYLTGEDDEDETGLCEQ